MADAPKSAYDIAMERLRAADPKGGKEKPLTAAQKEEIAEARRVAAAHLAEREILFRDSIKTNLEPAQREKAESEYHTDRQRINDDRDRAIEAIRSRRE